MIRCPVINFESQFFAARVEILKSEKRDDALRYGMNVNGISLIMKVFCGTVLFKKILSVKLKPQLLVAVKFSCVKMFSDVTERAQIIAGVKIVNPLLIRRFAIHPRAIGPLP